jgi:hypothetical protein
MSHIQDCKQKYRLHKEIYLQQFTIWPVTVAAQSKAWTAFARSDAGIVGSNPTQGMDVWYVYTFILC